jgi:hypothetical protein
MIFVIFFKKCVSDGYYFFNGVMQSSDCHYGEQKLDLEKDSVVLSGKVR